MSLVERLTRDSPGLPAVRGFLHRPETAPRAALVLTHGAGSDCSAPLLVAVAEEFCSAGILVLRCDLPFRQARSHGPPLASGAQDRAGLRRAVEVLRQLAVRDGTPVGVSLGGHSYGGRKASMLAADEPAVTDRLLLLSYPFHPPNKPQQLRTAHFAKLRMPALFVQGTRDAFGTLEEITEALALIPSRTRLLTIDGAGHDLGHGRHEVARKVLQEWTVFAGSRTEVS